MAQKVKSENKPKKEYLSIPKELEYRVQMTEIERDDGMYRLQAVLVHAKTLRRVEGARYKTLSATSSAELPSKRNILYGRVVNSLREKSRTRGSRKPATVRQTTRYAEAFQHFMEERVPVPGWRESTRHGATTWFRENFIPLLEKHYDNDDVVVIGGPALLEWKQEQRNKTAKHGNSEGDTTVSVTMARHFQQCAKIYECLCKIDPTLPPLNAEELFSSSGSRVEIEQVKSLPEDIRQKLWRNLESRIEKEPNMVFATVLMADAGLRTSEAAAVFPSQIEYYDDFAVLPILCQERDGARDAILKTDNAYRLVCLSKWGRTMVKKCGSNMKIPADDSQAPIRSEELSPWILSMLKESGCTKEFLESVANAESLFPDKVRGMVKYDPSAYLLRRDYASRCRNINGLNSEEIDYLLGHKPSNRVAKWQQRDFALLEELRAISYKLERYVYSTVPEYTAHPAYSSITVGQGTSLTIIPTQIIGSKTRQTCPFIMNSIVQLVYREKSLKYSSLPHRLY